MELIKIEQSLLDSIQKTIAECLPITSKAAQTISDSVTIANGLNQMREFFKNEDVQKLVESMADSKLGFLTDKPAGKKKWNQNAGKMVDIVPYTALEISEALIPMMLEGYRFTGNEVNIISGQGMPVKAGKHRKIIEYEGLGGFIHTVGSPVKDGGESGVAKMKCQAKWIIDGDEYSIGYGDDVCIIAVEYDKWSGLDKLVGLAESKLYSRILTRILGKFVSEGEITVIQPDKPEDKGGGIADKFKKQEKTDAEPKDNSQQTDPEPKESPQKSDEKPEVATDDDKTDWAAKLLKISANKDYLKIINDLIVSGEIKGADLKTMHSGTAKKLCEILERTKGFEDAEKSEPQESEYNEFFGEDE